MIPYILAWALSKYYYVIKRYFPAWLVTCLSRLMMKCYVQYKWNITELSLTYKWPCSRCVTACGQSKIKLFYWMCAQNWIIYIFDCDELIIMSVTLRVSNVRGKWYFNNPALSVWKLSFWHNGNQQKSLLLDRALFPQQLFLRWSFLDKFLRRITHATFSFDFIFFFLFFIWFWFPFFNLNNIEHQTFFSFIICIT